MTTTLAQLAPVANLIVDAELARTKVTDKGMPAIANLSNLRFLDLSEHSRHFRRNARTDEARQVRVNQPD